VGKARVFGVASLLICMGRGLVASTKDGRLWCSNLSGVCLCWSNDLQFFRGGQSQPLRVELSHSMMVHYPYYLLDETSQWEQSRIQP